MRRHTGTGRDKRVQLANIITPGIGFLLSVPGLVALLLQASHLGDGWYALTVTVYGCSLLLSYAIFTLYHIFKYRPKIGRLFKILDHASIYLLIAGTYTPITLVVMRGNWGWTLFGTVWGIAVLGIVAKVFFVDKFRFIGPLTYLFMGWLIVIAIKPVMALLPVRGLQLLLAGGLFYSGGLLFYAWKRLRFHHAIWHLFVLAGSICHYFVVYSHLALPPGLTT